MDSRSNLMKSISVIGVLLVFLAPYLSFIRDNIGVVEETDELYVGTIRLHHHEEGRRL